MAIDVSGWTLRGGVDADADVDGKEKGKGKGKGKDFKFEFSPGTVIPARSRVLVARDVLGLKAHVLGQLPQTHAFIQGPFKGGLSSQGLTLRDAQGEVIHALA